MKTKTTTVTVQVKTIERITKVIKIVIITTTQQKTHLLAVPHNKLLKIKSKIIINREEVNRNKENKLREEERKRREVIFLKGKIMKIDRKK